MDGMMTLTGWEEDEGANDDVTVAVLGTTTLVRRPAEVTA